jgi:two-component system, cell cycle sensor histidine kinase and response regulator CckA
VSLRLLLIEDSEDDALLLVRELRKGGFDPDFARVDTPQGLEAALDGNGWDAVVADYNMPAFTGLDALRIIQARGLDLPFILVSGVIGEEKAVEAMKAGAHDYIMKGNISRLAPALERELRDAEVRRERRQALEELHRSHEELARANEVMRAEIAERERAEEALRENERNYLTLSEQFDALLNAIPDRILFLDCDNRIIWSNRALAQEFDADPTGSEGPYCFRTLQKRSEPCAECPVLRSFASSRLESGSMTTPDGRIFDLRASPVFSADGKVRGVIEIARDVTEHQRLEAHLRHSQKMEAIGTLAGGIAHDFNNILTTIIGYGELLQMKMAEGEPLRVEVGKILVAAGRAAALTRGLLAYSRREALDLRPVDLNDIINKFYHMLSRIIGEDIELKVITSADRLAVLADAGQIEQVLTNLASNARDAMPRGGTLLITAKETKIDADFIATHAYGTEGRFAVITVSDVGSGMDKLALEHIFEPFFTTKEVGKGTGLGLAIVYGIVKQHGGFINVYSAPGEGTTFRLYLPLTDLAPAQKHQEPVLPARGKGETILLVEDNEEIRSFFLELLTGHGYRILVAADGEEGVEKFRGHSDAIDLLLLDVIMPRKNGKETYDEVRTIKPGVKALFMSGYTADIISRKGIDTEGLEFISKPFSPHALLMKIREVLDR